MSETMPRRVVCAANRYPDGFIVCGARHYDMIMHQQIKEAGRSRLDGYDPGGKIEQGFIDQYGTFLTRLQAWDIAEAAGQIVRRCGNDGPDGHGLFSENLY
jgi:hypothetical protein